ncbi:hypothetical protein HYH03_004915 [Edaphochlamys debaryana]|uniref:Fork-head domain-containing protein n=1 Tax=Edaphochlamys debaryana TaxID=47281 RepID=A0A835YG02_9CHLO|nr:hypothetical protein HYH03_004915 [Edaphochlamys debaryana]|eukprot:KAG2496909.1 hypothetical protein HYH03_004915 [Edaphochlamys debaryana]
MAYHGPEEGSIYATFHDVVHAAILCSATGTASLKEIYAACVRFGRVKDRKTGGWRLVTARRNWKSHIRHTLYTTEKFLRCPNDAESWMLSPAFSQTLPSTTRQYDSHLGPVEEDPAPCRSGGRAGQMKARAANGRPRSTGGAAGAGKGAKHPAGGWAAAAGRRGARTSSPDGADDDDDDDYYGSDGDDVYDTGVHANGVSHRRRTAGGGYEDEDDEDEGEEGPFEEEDEEEEDDAGGRARARRAGSGGRRGPQRAAAASADAAGAYCTGTRCQRTQALLGVTAAAAAAAESDPGEEEGYGAPEPEARCEGPEEAEPERVAEREAPPALPHRSRWADEDEGELDMEQHASQVAVQAAQAVMTNPLAARVFVRMFRRHQELRLPLPVALCELAAATSAAAGAAAPLLPPLRHERRREAPLGSEPHARWGAVGRRSGTGVRALRLTAAASAAAVMAAAAAAPAPTVGERASSHGVDARVKEEAKPARKPLGPARPLASVDRVCPLLRAAAAVAAAEAVSSETQERPASRHAATGACARRSTRGGAPEPAEADVEAERHTQQHSASAHGETPAEVGGEEQEGDASGTAAPSSGPETGEECAQRRPSPPAVAPPPWARVLQPPPVLPPGIPLAGALASLPGWSGEVAPPAALPPATAAGARRPASPPQPPACHPPSPEFLLAAQAVAAMHASAVAAAAAAAAAPGGLAPAHVLPSMPMHVPGSMPMCAMPMGLAMPMHVPLPMLGLGKRKAADSNDSSSSFGLDHADVTDGEQGQTKRVCQLEIARLSIPCSAMPAAAAASSVGGVSC